jgi:hypothetical protein
MTGSSGDRDGASSSRPRAGGGEERGRRSRRRRRMTGSCSPPWSWLPSAVYDRLR